MISDGVEVGMERLDRGLDVCVGFVRDVVKEWGLGNVKLIEVVNMGLDKVNGVRDVGNRGRIGLKWGSMDDRVLRERRED